MAARGSRWANFALAAVSFVFSILLIEIAYRIAFGLPMFALANWRMDGIVILNGTEVIVPDATLGWTLRPHNSSPGHNTLDHGIRRNFTETAVRQGSILAVGNSFTEGWEVSDSESWPAQLEKAIGKPVVNGGVGGYGTDQIVLRVEQVLPLVRPKTLIVGFLEFDIYRTGHTHFGSPKPYFTLENGAPRYHAPALLAPRRERGFFVAAGYELRDVFGHFASVDFLLGRIAPEFWYGSEKREYRKAPNDPVGVTCALLARLKKRVDAEGIRIVLFMQYYAYLIRERDAPTENARAVMDCATASGIQVVDQFAPLRAIAKANPGMLADYYLPDIKYHAHMTAKGNAHAAKLLAKALGE